MKKLFILLLFILQFSIAVKAQFNFEFSDSIPVIENGANLSMAWDGGLNYPQFSEIDFDYDGDKDLFIFDCSSDNVLIFENTNSGGAQHYSLLYNAQNSFPSDIRYRATSVDYNNDGKNDLFVYGIGGLAVYKNTGDAANGIQFTLVSSLLYSDFWGTMLNLYVSSSDIPAIVDVDGDSDIDILTYDINGEHLQYHQNQSMDLYGVPDSLVFVLKNECWGKFREDYYNSQMYLNDTSSICNSGNISGAESPQNHGDIIKSHVITYEAKHSGSTVLALDMDNNQVMDLIIGDVNYNNLNLMINGGTTPNTNSAMISLDASFPSNSVPVDIPIFPAAFYLDLDFDGMKDLVAVPNAKYSSVNQESAWFYKNTGSDAFPVFSYQTKAFLQENMIDCGSGSIPVIVDLDMDGLEDLVIANFYRYKDSLDKESTIAYYRNTGTFLQPEYTLVTDNFLQLNNSGFSLHMVPAFGDLDNDGDPDMLLGLENGTLVYYENSSSGGTITFNAPVTNFTDALGVLIQQGSYCTPQLFDLDNDGLTDLIFGVKTGELYYYRNTGTAANPEFTLENSLLGGIDVAPNSAEGYPVPHFFRINNTTHLFLGAFDGKLHYYNDIDNHLTSGDTFQLYSNHLLNLNVGAYSAFYVSNPDNDTYLDLFVGQDLGGLYHFEVDPNSTSGINQYSVPTFDIEIWPNPTNGQFFIHADVSDELKLAIYDFTGKVIRESTFYQSTIMNLEANPAGIYLIQLTNQLTGSTATRKVVKK